MSENEMELNFREILRKQWPGMPENDVISMAHSASVMGIYELGADSLVKEGVPHGKLVDYDITSGIFYPGSYHKYKVYLPANYDPDKAYPFTLFLDGINIYLSPVVQANNVLDNLIAEGRIPAMIGIFLDPGDHGEGMPIYGGSFSDWNSNRSREYDSVDDTFVRFLLEEFLPKVETEYRLSADPDERCLCGASSAANAVFNAAWFRPDSFHKVICNVSSFVNIRGGNCQPDRIRKSPKKPLRVFIQDGEHDLNIIYGDWVLGNKTMVSALEYRGYDYKYVLGKGGHNLERGGAILPETMEWMWRK